MPARGPVLLSLAVAAGVAGIPAAYGPALDGKYRNFRAVEDGVLYRSGQLSADALDRVVSEYGIRTVISLRDSYTGGVAPDEAERAACEARGVKHFRISPEPWSRPDGSIPAAEGVAEFVGIMQKRDELKPILVHCFAGIHRTGAQVAVYRMEFQGWSKEEAVAEMRAIQPRRATFGNDLLAFLTAYRPTRGR